MVPRSVSERDLGRKIGFKRSCAKNAKSFHKIADFMAPRGRCWVPFWFSSWAPRGPPKSSHFGTKYATKVDKMRSMKGVLNKSLDFWLNFDRRMGGLEAPDHRFYCSFTVLFKDSQFLEQSWKFMKIYAKMDPKSDPKIDVWARSRVWFLRILGGFLRRSDFRWIFDRQKVCQKSAFWGLRVGKRRF